MPGAAKTKSSEMNSLDWKEIEIKYRGRPIKGRYNVSDNFVTVAAWSGAFGFSSRAKSSPVRPINM
jgi:hypothetical protein